MGRPIPKWLDLPLPATEEEEETLPVASTSGSTAPPPPAPRTAAISPALRQRIESAVEAESNRLIGRPNLFRPAEPGERSIELARRIANLASSSTNPVQPTTLSQSAASAIERVTERIAQQTRNAQEAVRQAGVSEEAATTRARLVGHNNNNNNSNNSTTNNTAGISSIALISAAEPNASIHGTTIFVAPSFQLTVTSRAGTPIPHPSTRNDDRQSSAEEEDEDDDQEEGEQLPEEEGGSEGAEGAAAAAESPALAISLSTANPNNPPTSSARQAIGLLNDVLNASSTTTSTATLAIADSSVAPPLPQQMPALDPPQRTLPSPSATVPSPSPPSTGTDTSPPPLIPSSSLSHRPPSSGSSNTTLNRQHRRIYSSSASAINRAGSTLASEATLRSAAQALLTAIGFAERLEEATRALTPNTNNNLNNSDSPSPSSELSSTTASIATRSLQRSINQLRLALARIQQLLGDRQLENSATLRDEGHLISSSNFEQSREYRARERNRRRIQFPAEPSSDHTGATALSPPTSSTPLLSPPNAPLLRAARPSSSPPRPPPTSTSSSTPSPPLPPAFDERYLNHDLLDSSSTTDLGNDLASTAARLAATASSLRTRFSAPATGTFAAPSSSGTPSAAPASNFNLNEYFQSSLRSMSGRGSSSTGNGNGSEAQTQTQSQSASTEGSRETGETRRRRRRNWVRLDRNGDVVESDEETDDDDGGYGLVGRKGTVQVGR